MENFEGKVITVKLGNDTFNTYVYKHLLDLKNLDIGEDETVIEIDNEDYGCMIHLFSYELIKIWDELETMIYKLSNNINR